MSVTVECYRGIFVPQYFRQSFYVHAALEGARRKGVPQSVKTSVRYFKFFEKQFKASLVGTNRHCAPVRRYHERRTALFLYVFQHGQQLFRQRNLPTGRGSFRLIYNKPAPPVVAGL